MSTGGSLDGLVGKYLRLTDDLHEMRTYLNDIRICFIALTASCYVGIFMYVLVICITRSRFGGTEEDGSRSRSPRRDGSSRRRSRYQDDYDAESGRAPPTGHTVTANTDWDDLPPPPNGSAVKTVDGYRYKHPRSTLQQTQKNPAHNRLSQVMDTMDQIPPSNTFAGGKRSQLIIDNHTGTALMSQSSIGRRTPSDHAFRDGFIEKSPSIT